MNVNLFKKGYIKKRTRGIGIKQIVLLHKINEGIKNKAKEIKEKNIKKFFEILPDGKGLSLVLGLFLSIFKSIYLLKIKPKFLAPKLAIMINKKSAIINFLEINKYPERIRGRINTV